MKFFNLWKFSNKICGFLSKGIKTLNNEMNDSKKSKYC